MGKVVSIRKGFTPSKAQQRRAKIIDEVGMMLRRATIYDALIQDKIVAGGDKTFPGFAFKVNVYFQTEIEATEFQRLVNLVCRK
jgi:hypothetical protein